MREEAQAHFRKGEELARSGRWEEAIAAYQTSLRLNPDDAQTYLNLGFVYYELGYDAEARQAFDRARRLQACCGK
jgi:tetratricopeptide (TPR) repeat protein